MEKGKFNIFIHSLSAIVLAITLCISTAYAWYTSNTDVTISGDATVSSDNIEIYRHYVFKEEIIDTPYPARDANVPEGIINGESIYLSITIKDITENKAVKDLRISLNSINGGEFFEDENGDYYTDENGKFYNMCDLYTIQFHSSWGCNEDGSFYLIKRADEQENVLPFTRKTNDSGDQITTIAQMDIYRYLDWDGSLGDITIVFEMKFDTSVLDLYSIPADVAATKYMTFGQIVVVATDSPKAIEEGE